MKKRITRLLAGICTASLFVTLIPTLPKVEAAEWDSTSANVMIDKTGYKTEIFGTGTYDWNGGVDRLSKLPPSTVYLTDHYKETVATVPTSDWASSLVFDKYSESLYAHPLAFRATSKGMEMATPAVVNKKSNNDGEPQVESLLRDSSVELVVGGSGFTAKDAKVDKTTDWTYDVVMEHNNGNGNMTITLAKGSPYAYFKYNSVTPEISLGGGATNLTVYRNDTNSHQVGISVTNITDGSTHYYGLYAPQGTTWVNAGGTLTANFPSGSNYLSIATLPDNTQATFEEYAKYAYNFITDTIVSWDYKEAESMISTTYRFKTTNQETGDNGGETIMALYPHQWRYLRNQDSLANYNYTTIRGTMKTVIGNEYTTDMTYGGILPSLPLPTGEEREKLKEQIYYYWNYFKNDLNNNWVIPQEYQYGGYDTYWMGKNFNRISDVIYMAALLGDETYRTAGGEEISFRAMKDDMVAGLKGQLEYWFDPYQGYNQSDNYFYYHKDYGTMIGYASGYGSDFEVNDHHFHYGYWIKAAATVAMMDDGTKDWDGKDGADGKWEDSYSGMVYELISDIANTNRDGKSYNNKLGKSETLYPFLRNFDIYEGHSWASGVANWEYDANGNLLDPSGGLSGGNNQESSTEAVNAWAALILWGEAVDNEEIRDLGVYLYSTEVAAIEDYYYDVHGDVFTEEFADKDHFSIQNVTRLWGGKYDHTAWWTEDPIEVTTISMLPMTGATLYLGKYPEKVKAVYDSIKPGSVQWTNYDQNFEQIQANYGSAMVKNEKMHQDIIAEYYALYDPQEAIRMWDGSDNGSVEFGDSRAHTYGYIHSLAQYGTPNYDITGSDPFSMVFEKDGKKTYFVYNHSGEAGKVYFSDGTYVDLQAGAVQYVGDKSGEGENPDAAKEATYKTEYYVETTDGSYELKDSVSSNKLSGTEVTAEEKEIAGYTLDRNHEDTVASGTVNADGSLTLKLYYARKSYNISYELDGGSTTQNLPSTYKHDEEVNIPIPYKEGYVFDGWYTDAAFTQTFTATKDYNADLTLYAKYQEADQTIAVTGITLDASSEKMEVGDKVQLTAIIFPENATNKNINWKSSKDSIASVKNGVVTARKVGNVTITATSVDGNYSAYCNITVKKASVTTYKVTFDANGGTIEDSNQNYEVVADGEKVSEPEYILIKEGFTFKGWYLNGQEYDFETPVTSNITLVAQWEDNKDVNDKPEDDDTIQEPSGDNNQDGNSGNSNGNDQTGNHAGNMSGGNASDGNGTGENTSVGNNNVQSVQKQYTVVFESIDANFVSIQKIYEGTCAVDPGTPTREGYTFAGWYIGTVPYQMNTPVTGDMHITAKWETVQVKSIKITGMSKQIAVNKKIQLTATVQNKDAMNKKVKWSVDNKKYATVSQKGVVKVKKAGQNKTVKVFAEAKDGSGVRATYKIKIMPVAVSDIILRANATSVKAGERVSLKATVSPNVSTNQMNKKLQWTCNNTQYAKVSKNGVVTTYKSGKGKTVKITAKATDGSNKKKSITIKIQ